MAVSVTALARVPGLHCWPDAPYGRAYLASPHRHLFHVRATVRVEHNERDVEFHDLGALILDAVHALAPEYVEDSSMRHFGASSCETIARFVARALEQDHALDVLAVSCSEDDEYTATWTKD